MKTQNTVLSDINELATAFLLSPAGWMTLDSAAFEQFELRRSQALSHEFDDAFRKAAAMSNKFQEWALNNGYSGNILNVWWTARPGSMSSAVGFDVDQKKNPTDVLVQFEYGPCNGFLGLSAKATKGKTDIGFKNPGIGTIDRKLDLNLSEKYAEKLDSIILEHNLPYSAKERKAAIRADLTIKAQTEKSGVEFLSSLADALYKRLLDLTQEERQAYIIEDWMDADVPEVPYIKVTGFGDGTAAVCNPLENEKLTALKENHIYFQRVGNESIGVSAGDKRIMKIRFKFESEKMASSVKLSGESW